LGVGFSDDDFAGFEATRISAPIVAKPLFDFDSMASEQPNQFAKSSIGTPTENKGNHFACVVVNQMPSPVLAAFAPYK
jgi:hypothetical protein